MSRVCSSVSLFLHLNVGRNALEMSSIYPTQFCSSCGSSRPRVPNGVARSPAKRFGKPCRELVPDSRIYNLLGVCKSEGQLSFNNSSIPRRLFEAMHIEHCLDMFLLNTQFYILRFHRNSTPRRLDSSPLRPKSNNLLLHLTLVRTNRVRGY